jgi:hypothetical protein
MSVLSPKRNAATTKIRDAVELEHDPEKWIPVFGKDHAQTKKIERDCGSIQNYPVLRLPGRCVQARVESYPPFAPDRPHRTNKKPRTMQGL